MAAALLTFSLWSLIAGLVALRRERRGIRKARTRAQRQAEKPGSPETSESSTETGDTLDSQPGSPETSDSRNARTTAQRQAVPGVDRHKEAQTSRYSPISECPRARKGPRDHKKRVRLLRFLATLDLQYRAQEGCDRQAWDAARSDATEPMQKEHVTHALRREHKARYISRHLVDNVTHYHSSESQKKDWTHHKLFSSSGTAAVSAPHQAQSEESSEELGGRSALRSRMKMCSTWERNGGVARENFCIGKSLGAAFDAARQHEVIEDSPDRLVAGPGAIAGPSCPSRQPHNVLYSSRRKKVVLTHTRFVERLS